MHGHPAQSRIVIASGEAISIRITYLQTVFEIASPGFQRSRVSTLLAMTEL